MREAMPEVNEQRVNKLQLSLKSGALTVFSRTIVDLAWCDLLEDAGKLLRQRFRQPSRSARVVKIIKGVLVGADMPAKLRRLVVGEELIVQAIR